MAASTNAEILRSHVLLVEEDEAMASLVRAALQKAGMTCDHAARAALGMQMFRAREPHLVLLSLGLPNLGGIVLCPQIRAFSTVPIAILSVRTRREDQLHALNLGADDFLFLRQPDEQLMMARLLALLRRTYVYNLSAAAAPTAPPVPKILQGQAPEGWVTCESCAYMGPSHRFQRLDAAGSEIIMCPHCNLTNCVRFAIH